MPKTVIHQLDLKTLQEEVNRIIDGFEPSDRQRGFILLAEICIRSNLITITSWIEATKRMGKAAEIEDVMLTIPEVFDGAPMTWREWKMWNFEDAFRAWFWSELPVNPVSNEELALMEAKWWESIARGVAAGDPESLRMFSRIRHAEKGGGTTARDSEELRAWAQPKKSGWRAKTEVAEA